MTAQWWSTNQSRLDVVNGCGDGGVDDGLPKKHYRITKLIRIECGHHCVMIIIWSVHIFLGYRVNERRNTNVCNLIEHCKQTFMDKFDLCNRCNVNTQCWNWMHHSMSSVWPTLYIDVFVWSNFSVCSVGGDGHGTLIGVSMQWITKFFIWSDHVSKWSKHKMELSSFQLSSTHQNPVHYWLNWFESSYPM